MQYQILALGLVAAATASYAPPSYDAPSYGGEESSSSSVPAYPATTESATAPGYESPSTSSVPAYPEKTTSETVPAYPETTESASWTESKTIPSYGQDTTVTDVVSEYTTYCPEATTLTHGGKTYTVSTATTLTITSCPGGCDKTESATVPAYPETTASESKSTPYSPVESTPVVSVPTYAPSVETSYTKPATSPVVPYYPTGGNATTPAGTGSPSASVTTPPQYTGAASSLAAGAMVGFSGLIAALFM